VETKSAGRRAGRRAINVRLPLARSGETSPRCVAMVIHHPSASLPASVAGLTDVLRPSVPCSTDDFADQFGAHRRRRLPGSVLSVNDN